MPLVQTRGAASAQGFGEFAQASAIPNYIEDVFSCFLYTGTGATQTITNGIDLAGEGGLVWIKNRDSNVTQFTNHMLVDTVRGPYARVASNLTNGQFTNGPIPAFTSSGFQLDTINSSIGNENGGTYVSWTFRKQPKFFDVVTYTGTGANRTIAHNLGSVPGSIIVKRTDTTANWAVYHRSLANTQYLVLNSTAAAATGATWWNSTTPTSTVFSLGTDASVNASGGTYVAYLFAHDAGGFGLSGTDNVISCGSFTSSGSGTASITLGYEPQWVMIKCTTTSDSWYITDTMRGMPAGPATNSPYLVPNTVAAEASWGNVNGVNATGWSTAALPPSQTFIYIAIRRGPMKVPTLGTSVFKPVTRAGTSAIASVTGVGFPPDSALIKNRADAGMSVDWSFNFFDKLRNPGLRLSTAFANAEDTALNFITSFNQDGITFPAVGYTATNGSSYNYINYFFRRAPSFFDEVCYTGDGTANRQTAHNLTVVPELIIAKRRSAAQDWVSFGSVIGVNNYLIPNTTAALNPYGSAPVTASTATTFGAQAGLSYNDTGQTYVAYLFATCAGVSKVGSYTGTGALQTVNCGFTSGARFVLIKRTDSTGNWWVYDSARGITSGNDPYLYLSSTAAEVTGTNYVDTDSTGFKVTAAAPAELNANGGTFLFLAIA